MTTLILVTILAGLLIQFLRISKTVIHAECWFLGLIAGSSVTLLLCYHLFGCPPRP